jgi:hypothetical protein
VIATNGLAPLPYRIPRDCFSGALAHGLKDIAARRSSAGYHKARSRATGSGFGDVARDAGEVNFGKITGSTKERVARDRYWIEIIVDLWVKPRSFFYQVKTFIQG